MGRILNEYIAKNSLKFNVFDFDSCPRFFKTYEQAKTLVSLSQGKSSTLDTNNRSDINVGFINSTLTDEQQSPVLTMTGMLSFYRDNLPLDVFQENAVCLGLNDTQETNHPKYRSFNGYGNNLEHPFWGVTETRFGRFGPKNYLDGIRTMRRSDRLLQELPSPREIIENVMKKAEKKKRTKNFSNVVFLSLLAALAADLGNIGNPGLKNGAPINCCAAGNRNVLPPAIRHPSCIPITVPKDDKFYKPSGTRCMSMLRATEATTTPELKIGK